MKARDLMTRDVACVDSNRTLADAARVMWEHDCGIVPVVEEGSGKLLGVLTDRDICMGAFLQGLPLAEIPVSRVMSRHVFTCGPEADEAAVREIMERNQVRRVPVVGEDQRVVGLVSLNDLALRASAAKGTAARGVKAAVADTLAAVSRHHLAVAR